MECTSSLGNPLCVTNLERTVNDIIDEVLANYQWSEEKDIDRLQEYAYRVERQLKERGLIESE